MIWRPKCGQWVQMRYRPSMRPITGLHRLFGVVLCAGTGPGPINALVKVQVRLDENLRPVTKKVVVPRGNLFSWQKGIQRQFRDMAYPEGR
jgi:hypothetical protein